MLVAPELSRAQVESALERVHERTKELSRGETINGVVLASIEHPKHPGDASKRGTGLHFGVSQILSDDTLKTVFEGADLEVERMKKEHR